jgi:4-hydroxybenzoate polyprenyltransferase
MIKFEHSVFALPFALTGALAGRALCRDCGAAPGWPSWRQIAWIVVAMVGARSWAMTMNRIIDLRYDRENPRTRTRALATGALSSNSRGASPRGAAVLAIAAWQLNPLALNFPPSRSPSCFSIPTPSASRLGRTWCWDSAWECRPRRRGSPSPGSLDARMLILCAAVTLWVGGFDVLYACQDIEYDKSAELFSVPKRFGVARRWPSPAPCTW